jgi:hypothetical protein
MPRLRDDSPAPAARGEHRPDFPKSDGRSISALSSPHSRSLLQPMKFGGGFAKFRCPREPSVTH